MSVSEQIVGHLPELRRFARAVTGNQQQGDAQVATALEAIANDPGALNAASDVKIAMFREFCRSWRQVTETSGGNEQSGSGSQANADRRIAALVPRERLVFLLRQLEGFTTDQTAEILDLTPAEVDASMQDANADIARQLASRILIIEDEPLVSMDLSNLVEGLGHKVSAVARTHDEALASIARDQPALILADLQLADGSSGLDAVNDILREYAPPVVFITGYPELLLTGERPEPTFLMSKPYDPDAVKAMISQVLFFQTGLDSVA